MTGRITTALGVIFALLIILIVWRLFSEGVFEAAEARTKRAESLDGGALDQGPFVDAGVVDGAVADGRAEDGGAEDGGEPPSATAEGGAEEYPSLGIEGVARVGVHHLSLTDKQGRSVLRVRSAQTEMHLASMHEGTFRITEGKIRGAHITLYRDPEGKISLADALRTQDPSVQQSLGMPPDKPDKKDEEDQWAMEVGPIVVEDSVLTLGFTEKPVKFRIDHALVRVKKRHDEAKPRIYFDQIRGALLEPSPLPKPVPIAFAKGIVRLEGRPMVELAARTCVGMSELRVRAVVPARKKPVELTGDSVGIGGALGKMGLTIAAKKKAEAIHFEEGAVKIEGGPSCTDL